MRVTILTQSVVCAVSGLTSITWQGTPAAQIKRVETRRRTQRFNLLQPVIALAGNRRARVVDVSVNGIRLCDPAACPDSCAITLDWPGQHVEFTAERRWMRLISGEYHCGFEIQTIDDDSKARLRKLIEEANDPAYECHELVHGVWRKRRTADPHQPASGFTVRASESPHTIDFFRVLYFTGDPQMRERIRKLAELNITHPERSFEA